MNNFEKIKNMTVDEMASFFKEHFQEEEETFGCLGCAYNTSQYHTSEDCTFDGELCEYYNCGGDIKKWLLQEVKNGYNN